MRDISETLKTAQQSRSLDPAVKITLTHGDDSYTYTKTRILDINHPEEPFSQRCELVLDNSKGGLTAIDLKGFKGVLSKGAITSAGEEYDATAPLWVIAQTFNSSPGKLDCTLSLVGIPNLMADDKASASYIPDSDDTKTIKTLINEIAGATLACYSHCQAYEVVWKEGYDSLADTHKPRDSFRIYVGGSRLAAFRRLLDRTGNVALVKADGKWHIFKPTVSGEVYDYEYSLKTGHVFFSKAYRKRLVIPNRIVVQSQKDDDPFYSGSAQVDDYDDLPEAVKKTDYQQMRLKDATQADDIAAAILSKHQLWAELGAADVPMNVGAEVFDYVKVTDERENDYRIGNLGHLCRHYNANRAEWRMTFSFGNWMTVRKALANLDPTGSIGTDDLEAYFTRLMVKDAYIENLNISQINAIWLDPESNIDLSKIGDTLDSLPDGEVYARVKSLHIDAGIIQLDENIFYKAGYNPTAKLDKTDDSLDDVPDGTTYQRVKSAALTAGGLVLLDEVVVGTYGLVKSTYISAGRIQLWEAVGDLDDIDNGSTYKKVKATDISAGHIKLYVDQDLDEQGMAIISDSDEKVKIDANGIQIKGGELLHFYNSAGSYATTMGVIGGYLYIVPWSGVRVAVSLTTDTDLGADLGKDDLRWDNLYVKTVHEGDTIFANGWKLTETEDNKGMMLVRPDGSIAEEWR